MLEHSLASPASGCWKPGSERSGAKSFQQGLQLGDPRPQCRVLGHGGVHSFEAVNDRGMIPSAECVSDLNELKSQKLSSKEHGDLSRSSDLFGPGLGLEHLDSDTP